MLLLKHFKLFHYVHPLKYFKQYFQINLQSKLQLKALQLRLISFLYPHTLYFISFFPLIIFILIKQHYHVFLLWQLLTLLSLHPNNFYIQDSCNLKESQVSLTFYLMNIFSFQSCQLFAFN